MSESPQLSIVIPIYNEEGILREAVGELRQGLAELGHSYELILAENGSVDATSAMADHLAEEHEEVQVLHIGEPNYGRAMREGIRQATGQFVICDEIDLCDLDFYARALEVLMHGDAEMVVGSKTMKGADDQRPLFRRMATRVLNGLLRIAVDFRGTDTHGLKAFDRERLLPIVDQCVIEENIFASEFVVRAGLARKQVVEIPVRVAEKRRPATNLVRRVPNVLGNIAKLTYAVRFKK